MKTILLLSAALALPVLAEVPKAVPSTRYSILITNSPFTTKPPPVGNAPEVNPLDDYALGGVSPVPGGYRVTLLNKKNPEERIYIPDNKDFKLLSVHYAPGNPLGTTVRVSTGSKTGTVAVDEKLLTLKVSASAPPPQQAPPPGVIPPQPNGVPGQPPATDPPVRQPRPRVVPPPAATNNGGNGAVAPPIQQIQQQQQNPRINTQQRPNRR